MIQIGCVYTTFCQEGGILLQKYAIEMGYRDAFHKSIGVRGRFDSPERRGDELEGGGAAENLVTLCY